MRRFAGVPVIADQFVSRHDPDILAVNAQFQRGSGGFLQVIGQPFSGRHFRDMFPGLVVGLVNYGFVFFHCLGDLGINQLLVDQSARPDFPLHLHVVPSQRVAVQENNLVGSGKSRLA